MRVASLQLAIIEDDKRRALDHAAALVRSCKGADLLVLPELWNIGFMSFENYRADAETREGPTLTLLRDLARELHCYIHTGSFVEIRDGKYYNSSYLLDRSGTILGSYEKIHLFTFQSAEAQILTAGRSICVIPTELGTFGLATCYDLRFPEFFRIMTDRGAECFLVASAWPHPRLEHWLLFNRARALENLAYLISANSCGPNRGTRFAGHSQFVSPMGTVISEAGEEESVVWAEIDYREVLQARESFPALRDRVFTCR
jgi:predicted amidohydrolase